jgi:hypothetical protein
MKYGSQMFAWSPEQRLRNIIEELADARNYLGSGAYSGGPDGFEA